MDLALRRYDYVEVYVGRRLVRRLTGKGSHKDKVTHIQGTGELISIVFRTDHSDTRRGFYAKYRIGQGNITIIILCNMQFQYKIIYSSKWDFRCNKKAVVSLLNEILEHHHAFLAQMNISYTCNIFWVLNKLRSFRECLLLVGWFIMRVSMVTSLTEETNSHKMQKKVHSEST